MEKRIIELLKLKAKGEINDTEFKELFAWINKSEQNKQAYILAIKSYVSRHADKNKSKILERTWQKANLDTKTIKRKRSYTTLLKVAILLTIFLFLPLSFFKSDTDNNNSFVQSIVANDITTDFYLPDGIKVVLSRGSKLSINELTYSTTKEITINGKAYVEVTEETEKSLVINSGSLRTRINQGAVILNNNDNEFELIVEKGNVELTSATTTIKAYKIQPAQKIQQIVSSGQRLVYDTHGHMVISKINDFCEFSAWRNRVFCFNDIKAFDLAKKISDWYGVNIEFRGKVNNHLDYSGSFSDPDINDLIYNIFHVNAVKEGADKKTLVISFI